MFALHSSPYSLVWVFVGEIGEAKGNGMTKLTPKQAVLKRWPKAFCYKQHPTLKVIFRGFEGIMAVGKLCDWQNSERQAWSAAARHPSVRGKK